MGQFSVTIYGATGSVLSDIQHPRRLKGRNFEAGHTTAPDHMPDRAKKVLAFMGASTHVRPDCSAAHRVCSIVSALDSGHYGEQVSRDRSV